MNHNTRDKEPVKFTDNLTKFYKGYVSPQSQINAKADAAYLKERFVEYKNAINALRKIAYTNLDIPDVDEEKSYVQSWKDAMIIYFKCHNELILQDFDGNGPKSVSRNIIATHEWLEQEMQKQTIEECLKLINHRARELHFYGKLSTEWEVRLTDNLMNNISIMQEDEAMVFLMYLALIRRGVLFLHKFIGTSLSHQNWVLDPDLCYSVIFCEAFNETHAIVGAVMPERVPHCIHSEDQIDKFEYRQYILLTEIEPIDEIITQGDKYKFHKEHLKGDADKYNCFMYDQVNLRKDISRTELYISVQHKHLFDSDANSYFIKPLKIFKWMLKEPSVAYFKFNQQQRRWLQVAYDAKVEEIKQVAKFAEKDILSQLDSKKNTEKLAQLLEIMPILKIQLSELQQSVVKSNQNLLCLGRSGTGKTTTSVLRLFAQEVLYVLLQKQRDMNYRYQQALKQMGNEAKKPGKVYLEPEDLQKDTGTKLVFITASPVLTNEVMRFYNNLRNQLKTHVSAKDAVRKFNQLKREEAAKKKQLALKQDFEEVKNEDATQQADPNEEEEDVDPPIEEAKIESMEDQERKELLDFIKKEENLIIEDSQMEGQMALPNAFNQLLPQHFPLFVTVKRLIYMMDASLNYSFFSRDSQNRIIGLDSNLGWSNESKGVLMINHYYKENIDYDTQLAKFGKEMLELDNQAEINQDEEDINQGDNFYISEEQQKKANASSQQEDYRYQQYYGNNKRMNAQYILERQQLSFEVDYDIFEQKFWPKISQRRNMKKLSPTLIWTEIYSVIKGGMKSSSYYQGYLPKKSYFDQTKDNFLTLHEKRAVYYIFLEYEKWKNSVQAYDFMDIVTHVQKRLWYGDTLRRMKMDFLMVDEVQDLTPKTVQLLLQLTNHNVFFAGDTAQTIAKGVGARFCDLRNVFSHLDYETPKIVQLTKNYRSHGRILDVANSVVDLIELFFPKTIDKLQKEESELDGMVPLVIMPLDNKTLQTLFLGTHMYQQVSASAIQEGVSSPQFGCNQVLIVRDQAAKAYVPELFKNMLCLSVYEAKGLEFDDVILFNFFHLGDVSKGQWKLLNDIVYETVKKVKYGEDILQMRDFDTLDVEKFEQLMKDIKQREKMADENQEYEEEIQLGQTRDKDEVFRKFSMLCIELKFLYVAITRPKRRLIIYDEVSDGRKPLQNYWEKLGVIDVLTKDMAQNPDKLKEDIRNLLQNGALNKERSTEEEWRIQGIKLFKKKYYDAAIKCFVNSGDENLVMRCQAYKEAEVGQNQQSEADSSVWRAKTLKYLQKQDKKKLLKEAKRIRIGALQHFTAAGKLFEAINMLKHAASCFFTAKNYNKAAQIFEELGQFGQAAECLMIENQLEKAAKLYEKANLVSLAIECYENAGEWESLLHCLHRNKDHFKAEERESLVNKYVPVALNSLYKMYSEEDEDNQMDEENKGKMNQMKMKLKYQQKVNVIREEDNEDDLSQSEEEAEEGQEEGEEAEGEQEEEDGEKNNAVAAGSEEQQQINTNSEQQQEKVDQSTDKLEKSDEQIEILPDEDEEKKEQPNVNSDPESDDDEHNYDILDEVFQLKKMKSQKEEEDKLQALARANSANQEEEKQQLSFEVIDENQEDKGSQEGEVNGDDQAQQKRDLLEDFEHLSQYDPDDEFLRSSKSVSIIDSILSKRSISQTSEFSIVTANNKHSSKESSLISVFSRKTRNTIAFVETNRDIYAEDVITQKIIYYVSLFSSEVSDHLSKLRSKNVLFSQSENKKEEVKEQDFMIDLDDVDNDFINLILDALEYYELFRLCLMICNRYHMSDRLGRYLVSVCSKYSNLHLCRFNLDLLRPNHFNILWKDKQRQSSILAHEAIHNVFALINPKFLALKEINDSQLTKENSLGIDTYRMMMDLGFWKKLIYIVEGKTALQLCNKFFDRDNFEYLLELLDQENLGEGDKGKISNWHQQVVLRNFQVDLLGRTQDIQFQENSGKVFTDIKQEYNATEVQFKDLLDKCIRISEWLFKPTSEFVFKNPNSEAELAQYQKFQDERYYINEDILNILHEEIIDSKDQNKFKAFFIAFQLVVTGGHQGKLQKQLQVNIKQHFTIDALKSLINMYLKTLKLVNLENAQKRDQDQFILEALYSAFLVSRLEDGENEQSKLEENQDQSFINAESIFQHYKNTHMMVHRSSPLIHEIVQIQNNIAAKITNEKLGQQLVETRPKYFRYHNFRQAILTQLNDSLYSSGQKQRQALFLEKNDIAFILDMDSEFLLVPKTWIIIMLNIKLLNLSTLMSNELMSKISQEKYEVDNLSDSTQRQFLSLEKQIYSNGIQVQTMEKVNREVKIATQLHEKYVQKIISDQDKLKKELIAKSDYAEIVEKFWKKFNLNSIAFRGFNQYSAQNQNKFNIANTLKLVFNLGILHESQPISGVNELLSEAYKIFKSAFASSQNIKESQFHEQYEEVNIQQIRFQRLLKALPYYILLDKYELFVELIKQKKNQLKSKNSDSKSTKDQLFLLSKFLIAIDIHVFLKCGSFSLAADSMYQLLNTFYDLLTFVERTHILQNAFYLTCIGKFGKFFAPECALLFFDIGFNLQQHYLKNNECQFEEGERLIIECQIKDKKVEKITDDKYYNESLFWVIRVLKDLNQDETSLTFKQEYKKLYNILMTASVNDVKKTSKTNDQLFQAFELIASCPFEEYYMQTLGLQDVDYTSASGIKQLLQEFKETQNEYKYEFFARPKNAEKVQNGFVAEIDALQSQTAQAQKEIAKALDKSVFLEQKTLAAHLYLSMKLKKVFRLKRTVFKQRAEVKQFLYETRRFTQQLNVDDLLYIKQIPSQLVIDRIKLNLNKQMVLRQMIVSKFATSSQDLHYILSKANQLEVDTQNFLNRIHTFLNENGSILREFVDVGSDNDQGVAEITKLVQQTQVKFNVINNELSIWMDKKAEPNLIDVERKAKKYKIKWESLNLFEKKSKLNALKKKLEIIQSK